MGGKSWGDVDLPSFFSEDVFIQILLCLPVTSLLRFKSVCKSWLQLIESSFFMDLHTTTTTSLNSSSSSSSSKFGAFILQTIEPSYEKYELYMLSSRLPGEDEDNDQKKKKRKMVFKVYDLRFLPFYKDYLLEDALRMVGSCNGIICLHDPDVMDDYRGCTKQHYSNLRDVCLWNPATRQFRILPKSIPIQEKQRYQGSIFHDFIAFGFDVKTKDYKVLRISHWNYTKESEEGGCICRVQVYSLSTDSWRLLEGIHSLPVVPDQNLFLNSGIYLNGSYFFMATKFKFGNNDSMMLSFDFTKEIFTTMQLPDICSTPIFDELVLSYLGEKLVIYTTQNDIWVLNEQHGGGGGGVNKESWNKISDNGEFSLTSTVIVDGSWRIKLDLQLFNLVSKEAKNNFLITSKCRTDVYKESLVSIMSGGNVLLRWQLPTHGTTYKLNLDAPFIDSYYTFGIGLCLTSDTGGCIGVRSLRRRNVRDAAQGEAMAMLEAIKWAIKLELSPIIIESDSKNVVSFFMEDDDDDDNNSTYWSSEALSLLREAKILLLNSSGISFQYCSRSCNNVADIAAKLGRESLGFWACKDWTANFPGKMVRSLSKDLGSETR